MHPSTNPKEASWSLDKEITPTSSLRSGAVGVSLSGGFGNIAESAGGPVINLSNLNPVGVKPS